MATYHFSTPLREEDMRKLHIGDVVYLTGHVCLRPGIWLT